LMFGNSGLHSEKSSLADRTDRRASNWSRANVGTESFCDWMNTSTYIRSFKTQTWVWASCSSQRPVQYSSESWTLISTRNWSTDATAILLEVK
jgi:hypothetical protein